jgi:hypothetical protein
MFMGFHERAENFEIVLLGVERGEAIDERIDHLDGPPMRVIISDRARGKLRSRSM